MNLKDRLMDYRVVNGSLSFRWIYFNVDYTELILKVQRVKFQNDLIWARQKGEESTDTKTPGPDPHLVEGVLKSKDGKRKPNLAEWSLLYYVRTFQSIFII